MAHYTDEEIIAKSLLLIKRKGLVFINELISFLPITNFTFYTRGLNKNKRILRALEKNKVTSKLSMRQAWIDSPNPVLQVSLYKLLATDDELRNLSMQNIEQKTEQTVKISFK